MWHTYRPEDPDGDDVLECAECEVEVAQDAVDGFTIPCPADPCTDPMNLGRPCVFLHGTGGSACIHCRRPGRVTVSAPRVLYEV